MKNHFTKFLALAILLFGFAGIKAQSTFSFDAAVYSAPGYALTGIGTYYKSTSGGTTTVSIAYNCDGNTNSVSTSSSTFYFKPDINITAINIRGKGTGNARTFSSISTATTLAGIYTAISNGTVTNNMPLSTTCGNILIPGISVNAGTYIKIVLSGNVNITSLVLTPLCTAPTYSTQPTDNQTECPGGTNSLTVAADQSPTYQWYSNTSKSNTGGTAVSTGTGGTSATFTPASDVAGTFFYYCVATSSACSTASSPVQFTVNAATAINSQSTATATYGQNAGATALTVSAVGAGLNYQWYQSSDESNATLGDDVTVGTNSNSYTPSTLTIGTSYYYCVVTGGCTPTTATSAVSGAIIISSPIPTVSRSSGVDPASTTYNVALTPVVYAYVNVADDNNVISNWYTDNSYSTITTAPTGLSLDKNLSAKTVTLAGTPLAKGTFYYKISVNETNGNSLSGSVTVNAPPAPTVTLTSGSTTQAIIPGNAMTNIVYTLTNATGASVTGLPTGLTGNYSAGTYTISGTMDAGVTAGSYPFTVTATALDGYSGTDITATGTIVAKSLSAKNVLYLATDATTTSNDLFLAQLTNSVNYIITKRVAQAAFAGNYTGIDLIVLHESLTGGDAATSGHELNLIKSVDKPILNLKSYFYSTGRWSWGTPNNGNSGKAIKITQASHPVFNALSISDSLYIYNTYTAKNIQPTTSTIGGYQIAKVAGGIAIHDIPASVRLTSGSSKYLLISLLNGKYNDLTSDGLKLLDNAMNYLLSGTQFAPLEISSFTVNGLAATIDNVANTITLSTTDVNLDHVVPVITLAAVSGTTVSPASGVEMNFYGQSHNYTVSDGTNTKIYTVSITGTWTGLSAGTIPGVSFDGRTIQNKGNVQLQVFDTLGRLVESSNNNISLNSYNKGVYIVKSGNEKFKIIVTNSF